MGETDGLGGSAPNELVEGPHAVPRFRRLTHHQWEKTVKDLLRLPEESGLSATFREDPRQGGYLFGGAADTLEVDQVLWRNYQVAAQQLAADFAADEENVLKFLPPDADELGAEDKANLFIRRFGSRAYRRPLSAEHRERYREIYEVGTGAYSDQPGFLGGIRLLVETFLQSPNFLYRVEQSSQRDGNIIPLNPWERASRLSYFLWGTMPDNRLRSAARNGELDDEKGVRAQAKRMVAHKKAADVLVNFFEQVLEVERYESIDPSPDAFPDAPEGLAESAKTETQMFIRNVVHQEASSLRDLLTSTTTYVDANLADIYGLEGDFDVKFQEVELDFQRRRGILTQVGFLASHATSRDPDPIHRGVFVARRVNCMNVAAPPDNVPPLPNNPEGLSNRQLVEAHTEAEGSSCRNCHATIINPYGFAFENYDATGAYRTQDGEHPVDARVEAYVGQEPVEVQDALELSERMAESRAVHECFAGHLLSFAMGRNPSASHDDDVIEKLADASLTQAVPFRDLMVELAVTVAFLNRPLVSQEDNSP